MNKRGTGLTLHTRHFAAQLIARQVDQQLTQHARVHPTQCHKALGAALEVVHLAVNALDHQLHLAAVLATQAAQLEHLLGDQPALVGQTACSLLIDGPRGLGHHAFDHFAAPRQQLRRQRVFQCQQAAGLECTGVAVDAAGKRLTSRQWIHALALDSQGHGRIAALLFDLLVHGRIGQQRVGQRINLVQNHEARHRLPAKVVAPDRKV